MNESNGFLYGTTRLRRPIEFLYMGGSFLLLSFCIAGAPFEYVEKPYDVFVCTDSAGFFLNDCHMSHP